MAENNLWGKAALSRGVSESGKPTIVKTSKEMEENKGRDMEEILELPSLGVYA